MANEVPVQENRAGRPEPTYSAFMREVATILGERAAEKGYSSTGPDGPNALFSVTGPEHATGEIIYKAIRFREKHDPEDMIKAAAWAFLVWKDARSR